MIEEPPCLTELIQQGSNGAKDRLDSTLGLAGIVLSFLCIVRRLQRETESQGVAAHCYYDFTGVGGLVGR